MYVKKYTKSKTFTIVCPADGVLVFYNIGSENVASLCPYKPHKPRSKHSLPSTVSSLIYIKKFRVHTSSNDSSTVL